MLRPLVGNVHPGRDVTGMIYGTVVTAGTMIGSAESSHNELEIAVTVSVTLLIYWISHAYAAVLGGLGGSHPSWRAARRELAAESPMLIGCILPLVVLVVASSVGAGFNLSTSIAAWFTVALLFVWGYLAARRIHDEVGAQLATAAVFGLLGLGIVFLRNLFVH